MSGGRPCVFSLTRSPVRPVVRSSNSGTSVLPPRDLILDKIPGAVAAFSLRKLTKVYRGPCIRVRRSSDNAERDIGFIGKSLDGVSLLAHVGTENQCLYSEDFNVLPWGVVGLSLDTGDNPSPSGDNAFALSEAAPGSAQCLVYSGAVSLIPGKEYTASVFAKKNQRNIIQVSLSNVGFTDGQTWANFNLESGTVGHLGSAALDATITLAGDGWYRCSVTGLCASDGWAPSVFMGPLDTDRNAQFPAYDRTAGSGIFIWGAQLNEGSVAAPYSRAYSGPSGNGFVTTWYDQSGNGIHTTQGTAAAQPQIVSSGAACLAVDGSIGVRFLGAATPTTLESAPEPFYGLFADNSGTFVCKAFPEEQTNKGYCLGSTAATDAWTRFHGSGTSYPAQFSSERLDAFCSVAAPTGAKLIVVERRVSDEYAMAINGTWTKTETPPGTFSVSRVIIGASEIGVDLSAKSTLGIISGVSVFNRGLTDDASLSVADTL